MSIISYFNLFFNSLEKLNKDKFVVDLILSYTVSYIPYIKTSLSGVAKTSENISFTKICGTYSRRFGKANLSLDESLAENIVNSVSSDRIVIVCKGVGRNVIVSLLAQIGWKSHIQSIVTETDLINWYEKALRGKYSNLIGDELLSCLCFEIAEEFPSVDDIPDILKKRHYEKISDPFWI